MGQVLIRNIRDDIIDTYKAKAQLAGTSLEQYLRDLIEAHVPFTREERTALVCQNMAKFAEPAPALTLEKIRAGLL